MAQEVGRGLEAVQGLQQQADQLGVQMQASVALEVGKLGATQRVIRQSSMYCRQLWTNGRDISGWADPSV